MQLLFEGVVVGLVVVIMTLFIQKIFIYLHKDMEKNKLLIVFLVGFSTHLIFEFLGFNKMYCEKGFACLKK